MNLSEELALSYFRPVADIRADHSVQLVQHTETGKFYVQKKLTLYNRSLYEQLQAHPVANTPRIYAIAEEAPVLTVVEEYLPGDSLQETLDEKGPLSETQTEEIAMQLALIIRDLHRADPPIIHRDIKPSNLILTPDGVLKLLDFNAAKHPQADQTRDTVLMGTSGFAAPEQYGFGSSNTQTDLYSFGLLLNVLLTGKFPAEQTAQGPLAAIIKKCTELNPRDRYASIDDVIAALDSSRAEKDAAKKHRFRPPGFRSGKVSHMLTAVIGYCLLFSLAWNMEVPGASAAVVYLNRMVVFLMGLSVIFFTCDYGGIRSYFPLCGSLKRPVRILGTLLWNLVILFLWLLLLVILEPLF